ncbi:anti-sigma factor domain-containing protein [Deinococcus koreensis]|uniref:Anti-sigma factor n=1 Tax=Deinococcus koreensis TaxID=2054903 RepID=A0A2K3UVP7_9DEIO|nr:anti-sigma factor [Deinococcus koreensis]PNY80602.1 anti-sigma factor [Deinococcus koreensis]
MNVDRDQVLASALGQLSPAEEAEVQAALKANPSLQAQWQADQDALSLLLDELDLEDVQVPADAEDRLMTRLRAEEGQLAGSPAGVAAPLVAAPPAPSTPQPVARPEARPLPEKRAARPAWWLALPLGLAAALALLFALRPAADPLQQYAGQPGAVSREVTAGGQTLGTLVRLSDGRVFVKLRRPTDTGRTYQLWRIQAGKPVSLGVFGEQGVLTSPLPQGATLAVSVEPPGGSAQPTTQPLFAQEI